MGGSVVVVGSVNTDYVVCVERRPAPGETVLGTSLDVLGGGKGANQAVAAVKSGAPTELVACLGDDAAGDSRLSTLGVLGVGTTYVRRVPGCPSGAAFITVTPDGQNDIIVVAGANERLGADDVERAGPAIDEAAVVVAQMEVPAQSVARAILRAAGRAMVVLNCAPYTDLAPEVLSMVDLLVVNELEAAALTGAPVPGPSEALDVAEGARRLGPRAVVVTLGSEGAAVAGVGVREHVPAEPVSPVDTTGAGDAFVGALAARLAAGDGLVAAVWFGVEVGTATTLRAGAEAVVPQKHL